MSFMSTLFRRSERDKVLSDLMKLDDHLLRDIGVTRADLTSMRANRRRVFPSRGHE